ncbi:hypothetical protein [Siccirubricoccus phaeus]|uniref:hypothetical protein n=1 Tax=Siccirubricoccus phaeus TaxID=2595053 RepID=UPI001A9C93CE|nr:hypothetical protein [Siccirubricoccus phaeus]
MALVPISERSLREAMREPRYWQAGHPEREAFGRWVSQGWQALYGKDGPGTSGGVVFVRAYSRVRNGKVEEVGAHLRSAAERDGAAGDAKEPSVDGDIIPVMGRRGAAWGIAREYLERLRRQGSGLPGSRPAAPPAPPRAGAAIAPRPNHQDLLRQLRDDARFENTTKGNTTIWGLNGGRARLEREFDRFQPGNVQSGASGSGPYRVGELPDGLRIVARGSRDGRPTLQVQRVSPNGSIRTLEEFRFAE